MPAEKVIRTVRVSEEPRHVRQSSPEFGSACPGCGGRIYAGDVTIEVVVEVRRYQHQDCAAAAKGRPRAFNLGAHDSQRCPCDECRETRRVADALNRGEGVEL